MSLTSGWWMKRSKSRRRIFGPAKNLHHRGHRVHRGRPSSSCLVIEKPLLLAALARFSQQHGSVSNCCCVDPGQLIRVKGLSGTDCKQIEVSVCTKSCHGVVDGLHLIENMSSYRRGFSIDVI